jgi:hypothetical protein
MSDLAPRYGDLTAGLYGSARAVAQLIILPIVSILVLSALMEDEGTVSMQGLDQAILGLKILFIIFGSFLALISFLREFYPAGSWSRLFFGEFRAAVVIGLGYVVLIGQDMQGAVRNAGVDIDMISLFFLFALLMGLGMLYTIGEWVDYRRAWQRRRAEVDGLPYPFRKERSAEDSRYHRVWQDFRFRYGRLTKGIRTARGAMLRYVILPVASIIIIKAVIATMGTELTDSLSETLGTTIGLLLLVGIPIVVLSFFKGFYPKGSVSRMTFSIVIVALLDLWIWVATLQGRFQAVLGEVRVDLDYQPYVLFLIFGVSLWAFYYVAEMVSYRKDWIAQNFEPVDEAKAAERRLREKEFRRASRNKERTQ